MGTPRPEVSAPSSAGGMVWRAARGCPCPLSRSSARGQQISLAQPPAASRAHPPLPLLPPPWTPHLPRARPTSGLGWAIPSAGRVLPRCPGGLTSAPPPGFSLASLSQRGCPRWPPRPLSWSNGHHLLPGVTQCPPAPTLGGSAGGSRTFWLKLAPRAHCTGVSDQTRRGGAGVRPRTGGAGERGADSSGAGSTPGPSLCL